MSARHRTGDPLSPAPAEGHAHDAATPARRRTAASRGRRGPARTVIGAVMALIALAALAPTALGAGITLDRVPSPPQAVARGVGAEQLSFDITYTSVAERWTLTITDPAGVAVFSRSEAVPSVPSPIRGSVSWTPAAAATPGRYTAALQFFSSAGLESTATVVFDVADQLGTLRVVKFEDVNGNGRVDAGEPQVPNWRFRLVNPQGNTSQVTTGPDGSATITGVPAGTWQVEEITQTGWVPTTAAAGTVSVPNGGTGVFTAGNARPAPLSGTVFIDANANAVREGTEAGRGGVTLTLTGTTGLGAPVNLTTVTAPDGTYQFPDLLPGTYAVSVTVPGGFTATTGVTRPNRLILSGVGNPNNDFGIRQGGATIAQAPDVTIRKLGPATANRGSRFTYSITVRNTSAFPARNVQVTDLVPEDLTLLAIPAGATIRNGVVTWVIGTMAPNAARTLRMRVRVNPTSTVTRIRNTATVTASGLAPRRSTVTTGIRDVRAPVRRTGGVTG